jgi:histidinol dehydrogenase
MKILTLEEWIKKFGGDYPCKKLDHHYNKVLSPERQLKVDRDCICKNCKQARQDYQKAIAADKKKLEEFERTQKPKE